jgi:hypothetical protein
MPIIIFLPISFLLLAMAFVFTSGRGVPWVPAPMNLVHTALRMAEVGSGDVVYDLGCGDGRTIVMAVRRMELGPWALKSIPSFS